MDHFSDLNYVHLMRSTTQDENLAVKSAFEIWAAPFGVKVKRYHTDNGKFAEKTFRSDIEDSNNTITFCGVRYHHQSSIFEIKTQTLKLGSRTLLVHVKIYWPDSITTIYGPMY